MEIVRYRPGEAIRWLQSGAESFRKGAVTKGRSVVRQEEIRKIQDNLRDGMGALVDLGRSAWTDLLHRQAEASEYVLQEKHFDVVRPGNLKTVEYARVKSAEIRGDRMTLHLDRGTLVIKPYAYVVAGRVRVPIGWSRNGLEVPYELLAEELCARSGVELEVI
jgi:hypothetical protein